MPMVLTLNSGSAFAAVSAAAACAIQKPGTHPHPAMTIKDSWKRTRTKGMYCEGIGVLDLVFLDPWSTPERWYQINQNNTTGTPFMMKIKDDGTKVMIHAAGANNPNALEYPATSREFGVLILVHVTPDGMLTGVVGYDNSGNLPFMTVSCFDSIHGF
jgi:hypothetical protein